MERTNTFSPITQLWVLLQRVPGLVQQGPPLSTTPEQQILSAIQALPEPIGQCIRLRYLEHQGISTIALAVGCSKRSVRNSLDKGLHRLRKQFNPAYSAQLESIKQASLVKSKAAINSRKG